MSHLICCSCGDPFIPRQERWSMVDPEQSGPVEILCQGCLEQYRLTSPASIVYLNRRTHTATLLSDAGMRLAHLEAHGELAA